MKTQCYYNTEYEDDADICNTTDYLCVNCVGVVNETNYGTFFKYRERKDYYLMYMLSGDIPIVLGENETHLSEGQLIIMKPHTPYKYQNLSGNPIQYIFIHFSGFEAEKLVCDCKLPLNTISAVGIHDRIIDSCKRMFYEFVKNDDFSNELLCCILKEILASFSRYLHESPNKRHFSKALLYIHEHYNSDISISKLASIESMSETHFRAEFKKNIGVSPKEYLINLRMKTACTILSETRNNISETAHMVGYSDAYYFSRIFKKKLNISPQKYRAQTMFVK